MRTLMLACLAGFLAPAAAVAADNAGEPEETMGPAAPEAAAVEARDAEASAAVEDFAVFMQNMKTLAIAEEAAKQAQGLTFFGAGPAVTLNLSNRDRVEEANLDENGIVRLTKQSDASVGIFLEAHYLWEVDQLLPLLPVGCPGTTTKCGFGPFVGVQPGGSDEIIEGIGAGVMWGFKGTGGNIFNSSQFNVGLGVFVDPSVKTLGAGQFQDQPLPEGETNIRYQEDFQANVMLIFTVNPF